MSPRLKSRNQIRKLARDLGLGKPSDPLRAIVDWCERRVQTILKEFPHCTRADQLLEVLANKLGTEFQVVRTDAQLRQLQHHYVSEGEKAFARLEEEFTDDVYGITFRRTRRKFWEPEFVSVIDSRGEKGHLQYYTKSHEVGHLLILPDVTRASFERTHWADADLKDNEESLVDIVAGRFGFSSSLKRRGRRLSSFSQGCRLRRGGPGSKVCGR
jgi:hypothetical protein